MVKSFFVKVFLIIAAMLCMFEGLVLFAVGMGRLSSERLLSLYNGLLGLPKALAAISGIGFFFVILGFILLAVSSRSKPAPRMIEIEKDGKVLTVPQSTLRDFIKQIIDQNPYVSDSNVEFEQKTKGGGIDIKISSAFNGVPSIYQELDLIETTLKDEIQRVFEWKDFKFTFRLRGVSVDPKKKYFASSGGTGAAGAKQAAGEEIDNRTMEEIEAEVDTGEEASPAKTKAKGKTKPKDAKDTKAAKDNTFLSKLLYGK